MDSTLWGALIGAGASLVIFIAGGFTNAANGRSAARAAAQAQARGVAEDLMRAALDFRVMLAVCERQAQDKRPIMQVVLHALVQSFADHEDGRPYRGLATSLGTMFAWSHANAAKQEAIITGPMSQVTAAAARVAMLDDQGLRTASTAVTSSLGQLMTSFGQKPESAVRREAEKAFEEAIGMLGDTARAYDGRPRRRRGTQSELPSRAGATVATRGD